MSLEEQKQKLENMRQLRNKLLTLSASDGVASRNGSRTSSQVHPRSPREAADYYNDNNAVVIAEMEDPTRFENRDFHWYQKELLRTEKRLLQEQETNARLQMQLEGSNVVYANNVKPSVEIQNENKEKEYRAQLEELKRKLTAATEEVAELLSQCQALTVENQKLLNDQKLKALEYNVESVENQTALQKLNQEKIRAQYDIDTLEKENTTLKNYIAELEQGNIRLSEEVSALTISNARLTAPGDDFESMLKTSLQKAERDQKRILELETTINERNARITEQSTEIESLAVEKLSEIAAVEERLQAIIDEQRAELDLKEKDLASTKTQAQALTVQVATLEASNRQKVGDIELLEGEKAISERTIEALRENVETLQGYLARQTGLNEQKAAANEVLLKEKLERMHEGKDLWAKIDQLQDSIAPLKGEIRAHEATIVQLHAEIDARVLEANQLRRDLAKAHALLKHCREEVEEQVKGAEDVHVVREELSHNVGTTQRSLDDARRRLEACEAKRVEAVRQLELATLDHERRMVELVASHQRQLDTLEAEVKARWDAADAQNAELTNVSITQLRERLAAGNRRVSQLEDDLRLAQLEVENWRKLDEARRNEMEKLVAVAAQGGDNEGNASQLISSLTRITEQYSKRRQGKTELTKTLGQVAKELMDQADEIEVEGAERRSASNFPSSDEIHIHDSPSK